jgi:hypothetical protein
VVAAATAAAVAGGAGIAGGVAGAGRVRAQVHGASRPSGPRVAFPHGTRLVTLPAAS